MSAAVVPVSDVKIGDRLLVRIDGRPDRIYVVDEVEPNEVTGEVQLTVRDPNVPPIEVWGYAPPNGD
jgi:hypothetical protein